MKEDQIEIRMVVSFVVVTLSMIFTVVGTIVWYELHPPSCRDIVRELKEREPEIVNRIRTLRSLGVEVCP